MRQGPGAAWLMAGMSPEKKAERRARWWSEVIGPSTSNEDMIERGMRRFQEELDEDRP